MESSIQTPPQELTALMLETRRILESQPRRLIALFLAFLFVSASSTTILYLTFLFPFIYKYNIISFSVTLPLALSCFLLNLVFSSCAIGSITHSVFRSSEGKQDLNVKHAIKPLATSFFPLLFATFLRLTSTTAVSLITFAMLLGLHKINFYPPFLLFAALAIVVGLMALLAYFQSERSLATTITALEPAKWGFEPLRLSRSLINGKEHARKLAFSVSFRARALQAAAMLITCYDPLALDHYHGLRYFLVQTGALVLLSSIWISVVQLNHIAANTLFYKTMIDDAEHGNGYTILPANEANVENAVSFV